MNKYRLFTCPKCVIVLMTGAENSGRQFCVIKHHTSFIFDIKNQNILLCNNKHTLARSFGAFLPHSISVINTWERIQFTPSRLSPYRHHVISHCTKCEGQGEAQTGRKQTNFAKRRNTGVLHVVSFEVQVDPVSGGVGYRLGGLAHGGIGPKRCRAGGRHRHARLGHDRCGQCRAGDGGGYLRLDPRHRQHRSSPIPG